MAEAPRPRWTEWHQDLRDALRSLALRYQPDGRPIVSSESAQAFHLGRIADSLEILEEAARRIDVSLGRLADSLECLESEEENQPEPRVSGWPPPEGKPE